jgi:twitching motility protein PilT
MFLQNLITQAKSLGASDLHLEPGLPPAFRLNGTIQIQEGLLSREVLLEQARSLLGDDRWAELVKRGSYDLSHVIAGQRCRINIFRTMRGIGFAVRLLHTANLSLEVLNLHPSLLDFCHLEHGLVVISGPTGSGKSSTLAALVNEINVSEPRHIITLESPIEYFIKPRRAYIRQREIGRDSPSFSQAILDSLREDPDVLVVGEMRDPETIRLVLTAAETGHLVMVTLHSGSTSEAVERIVGAFAPEIQHSVAVQLADCLRGVIVQRLVYQESAKILVPECEILRPTAAARAHIRAREPFKLVTCLETGADSGCWTFQRYRAWLRERSSWSVQKNSAVQEDESQQGESALTAPILSVPKQNEPLVTKRPKTSIGSNDEERRIEIEPFQGDIKGLLKPK